MTKIADTVSISHKTRDLVNINNIHEETELIFNDNSEHSVLSTNEKIAEIEQKLEECRSKLQKADKSGAFTGGLIGLFATFGIFGSDVLEDSEFERIGQKFIDKIELPRNKNLAAIGIIAALTCGIMGSCVLLFRELHKIHCKTMVEKYEHDLELEKAKINTLS